jgi:two-component system, NarL family, response regulator DesR
MRGTPITVLLADDDEGFLASLGALIDGQPELTVIGSAPDGLAAIELAARLQPDAAVIDLRMPLLGGTAVIARLRQDHRNMCLIALTGDDDPKRQRAARAAGADAVIHKRELLTLLIERLQRPRAA